MDPETCRRARLARDPRFDGRFFTAVKTTGIYCRPICPARAPKEQNVTYFGSAIEAANHGYRPCLRCRPDSAPASFAWKGADTTVERALRLIDSGALIDGSIPELCDQLGIGPRYLNKLFQARLGASPKQYAQYQQLLFAKSLLQQTRLPIAEIALAAGFGSVRRFNDCFAHSLQLTPSELRRRSGGSASAGLSPAGLNLFLSYRPPYDWNALRDFLHARLIPDLEWCGTDHYGRTFDWPSADGGALHGRFTARHRPQRCGFEVSVALHRTGPLLPIVRNIRRLLDLDADIERIDLQLAQLPALANRLRPGLRLPGIWDPFEAGVRAILGQQVSIAAARGLVTALVHRIGPELGDRRRFPSATEVAGARLDFLKMPASRRDTLARFAGFYAERKRSTHRAPDPDQWQALKGIGPWTVSYARMRGLSDSDIWLGTDLGVQRTLQREGLTLDPQAASPWRSYLTFQLWNLA
ncbi:MAG: AlkA N-terminal domain-containing protein [Wenzhouxiangellaceae bacterium]|nr:AlkA N-terminal domain-containing protein [Wenzhouxiangellaceae bacterium]